MSQAPFNLASSRGPQNFYHNQKGCFSVSKQQHRGHYGGYLPYFSNTTDNRMFKNITNRKLSTNEHHNQKTEYKPDI